MKKIVDTIFARGKHVCPWWACYFFDNPMRKLFQNPYEIISPYVRNGFIAVDIGPGMGYFTIPLLKLVGKNGRVIALDIQEKMLSALKRRATKTGVDAHLVTHLSKPNDFGLNERADFILAFWMLHEVPDKIKFFRNVKKLMKSDARVLIAEPKLHVTKTAFGENIFIAEESGLKILAYPPIPLSRAVILTRS